MLFQEILDKKFSSIGHQFDLLHNLAAERQTHGGDLLLVHQNGFYNPEVLTWDNFDEKLSPYLIGPNVEGHSDDTHYSFITHYVQNHLTNQSYTEYLKSIEFEESKIQEIDKVIYHETMSVQTEMLIYLKIWQSDTFIKKLYQLVLLINKQPYDWHFKITRYNREKNTTGTRDVIIREKIRDKLDKDLPILKNHIEKAYSSQVRNAIAHSEYAILGRRIELLNYDRNDPHSQMQSISFDDWVDRFHETLMIYSCYDKLMKPININYGKMALYNNKTVEIRVNRMNPIKETQYLHLFYREHFEDWGWYPNKY